ncbi:conserved exported hypothetical protein [uncultured Desulfobacterium sp.]|uniref:DUF481 domain-containing protein n=1 Tax=uncultured Desulfobacterium sp. TaxID=201089 RepID=A0A445MV63_9BACT|nr:conserved exported hypothetical protein [uncultured Desulfobacterium sp.]
MQIFYCFIFITLLMYLSAPSAMADIVELDNGSKIVGNIEKILEGKLLIKTDFAGDMTIPMKRVVSFSSDKPMFVTATDDEKQFGIISYSNGHAIIKPPDSEAVIEKAGLVAAWPMGVTDPLASPERKWSNEAGVDLLGKRGNTERISTGGKLKASLSGPVDNLLLYLRWYYAEKNEEEIDDEITGGVDFETSLSKKLYWYSRLELERDDIEDVELRTTLAAGNAYYFLKKPDHVFRTRAGLSYLHESFVNSDSETTIGIDLGIHYMYQPDDWGTLYTDITYTPSFEDLSDYLAYHESAFEMPLSKSDTWKLQIGVANKYTSMPIEGNKKLDTIYFTRLVLRWGVTSTDKGNDFKERAGLKSGLGRNELMKLDPSSSKNKD